jgi:protein SCO1/2
MFGQSICIIGGRYLQKFYTLIALICLAVFLISTTVYILISRNSEGRYANCRGGQVAGNIGGSFSLINQDGIIVSDKDIINEPSLIYFGYTFCPDICPLDSFRNAEAVTILEESGYSVTPIFITFDPERDTAQVLKQFTSYMHPKMIGLTGSIEQIKNVAKKYRVYFKKQNNGNLENYVVDHTAFTYLVLPEIGFVDFFRRDLTAKQLADKVSCFMN